MSENLHDIDDLFRRALNEHEDEPSPDVWENLDKQLDKNKIVHIRKKYHNLKWVAAALFIFSFAAAMYAVETRIKNRELVRENRAKTTGQTNEQKTLTKPKTAPATSLNNSSSVIDSQSLATSEGGNKTSATNAHVNLRPADNNKSSKAILSTKKESHLSEVVAVRNLGNRHIISKDTNNYEAIVNKTKSKNTAVKNNVEASAINKNEDRDQYQKSLALSNKSPEDLSLKDAAGIEVVNGNHNTLLPNPLVIQPNASTIRLLPLSANNLSTTGKTLAKNIHSKSSFSLPISLTAFYSPDAVSANLKDDHPHFREDDKNEIKDKERHAFSYTTGFLIAYNFKNKFSLQSGITYMTRVTEIGPKTIFARPDEHGNVEYRFNCSAGVSYLSLKSGTNAPAAGDSVTALPSKNTLQYVGVPLAVKYNLIKGNFIISPTAGISANFLAHGKIETGISTANAKQDEVINNIDGLKSSYLSGMVGVDLGYKITSRLSLSVAPTVRFGLTSINKDAPVQSYLNSFGLAGGLTFRL